MSTSVGVNVLRWGALATGVFYGLYNQVSISSRERLQAKQREWDHHESLIQQAKAEWAKTHPSEQPKPASSGGTLPTLPSRGPVISPAFQDRLIPKHCGANVCAAKADSQDPNADINVVLGIADEK
ncbi:mitochondrial f0 subunit e [Paraphaeosphaeria sporulosa]